MAILPQVAAIILKEHKRQPIAGDVVLIGRQTVALTEKQATSLLQREGVELRAGFRREIDTTTAYRESDFISDRAFFSMFTDAHVIALDVSAYEGAEIIHDLNEPLPDRHCGVADFIFNGSCMDNLFDPACAIKSMSKMLRPNGRILHLEHGTPVNNAMLAYSPEWFFGFYAVNDYADCRIYVCAFGSSIVNPWAVYRWRPFTDRLHFMPNDLGVGDFVNIVVAEKSASSTDDKTPIQLQYVTLHGLQDPIYLDKHNQFSQTEPYSFRSSLPVGGIGTMLKGSLRATVKRTLLRLFKTNVRVGPERKYIIEKTPPRLGYL
jgi:SAM-dependent methyltransferase